MGAGSLVITVVVHTFIIIREIIYSFDPHKILQMELVWLNLLLSCHILRACN